MEIISASIKYKHEWRKKTHILTENLLTCGHGTILLSPELLLESSCRKIDLFTAEGPTFRDGRSYFKMETADGWQGVCFCVCVPVPVCICVFGGLGCDRRGVA